MALSAIKNHRARLAQGFKENIRKPRIGGLFWWSIAITILSVLAVASWFFSIFVFAHPEMPRNYKLLMRMEKLEPIKAFLSNSPPRGRFRSPRQIYEDYSRYNDFLLVEINAILKRDYIENYKRADRISYFKGDFTIYNIRPLTKKDVFTSGWVVYAISTDYPKVHVEYILPGNEDKRMSPKLFRVGETLIAGSRDSGPTDFSTPIHIERINDDELLVTVVPLVYKYKAADQLFLKLKEPDVLNMDGRFPILRAKERAEEIAKETEEEPAPAEPVAE